MSGTESIEELPKLDLDATITSDLLGLWAVKPDRFKAMWRELSEGPSAQEPAESPNAEKLGNVAIVSITGPMTKERNIITELFGGTSSKEVRGTLRRLANDDDVGAIVLHIDSPGGTVAGTGDLADTVDDLASDIPIFTFFEDLGASAAYFVGSQGSKVFANRHAMVGSIGVFAQVFDVSEQFEEHGIKSILVKSGEHKGDFAFGEEVTEDQIENLQREIDQHHELFVGSVARGRDMSVEEVEGLADGRVHIASVAKDLDLIDEVSTLRNVIAAAGARAGSPTDAQFHKQVDAYMAKHGEVEEFDEPFEIVEAQTKVPSNPEGGSGEGEEGEWDADTHASLSAVADWVGTDAEEWGDFTESEKNQAARIFADAADSFTEIFDDDLNLPHHFTQNDDAPAASLNGVRNALARLPQTEDLHSSEEDIESHLNAHLPDDEEEEFAWHAYLHGDASLDQVLDTIGVTREDIGLEEEEDTVSIEASDITVKLGDGTEHNIQEFTPSSGTPSGTGTAEIPPVGRAKAGNGVATITGQANAETNAETFRNIKLSITTDDDGSNTTEDINSDPSLVEHVNPQGDKSMTKEEEGDAFEEVESDTVEVSAEDFKSLVSEVQELREAHKEEQARRLQDKRKEIAEEHGLDASELKDFDADQLARVDTFLRERDDNSLHGDAGATLDIEVDESEPWRNEEYEEWRAKADAGKLYLSQNPEVSI